MSDDTKFIILFILGLISLILFFPLLVVIDGALTVFDLYIELTLAEMSEALKK